MRTILFAVITLLLSIPLLAQELPGWEKVYETDSDIGYYTKVFPTKMSFPTSNVGYFVLPPDTLMVTVDKGVTWKKVQVRISDSVKVYSIDNISFYSESEGFISSIIDTNIYAQKKSYIPHLIKVTDFAKKFKRISLPATPHGIYSIHFFNPSYGVCVIDYYQNLTGGTDRDTAAAAIVATYDGCRTWTKDLDEELRISLNLNKFDRMFQVMDSLTWFNTLGYGDANEVSYLYKFTSDAGKTWTKGELLTTWPPLALRMNYLYDLNEKRYYDESLKQYVYSRIYYASENKYFDSLPKQFQNTYPTSYSYCKNGFVVMYGEEDKNRYLFTSTDSCKTWTMVKVFGWENYKSAYVISAVTTNDGWAFLLCRFSDSTSQAKWVIYRKHLDTNTGVKEEAKPKITIYPNPTGQILRWNVPNGKATITDALGLAVLSVPASNMEADVSGLAIGVYYLTIRSGGESVTRVFTVMR